MPYRLEGHTGYHVGKGEELGYFQFGGSTQVTASLRLTAMGTGSLSLVRKRERQGCCTPK